MSRLDIGDVVVFKSDHPQYKNLEGRLGIVAGQSTGGHYEFVSVIVGTNRHFHFSNDVVLRVNVEHLEYVGEF